MAFENQTQSRWSEMLTAERLPRLALVCLGIWLNAADSLVTATIMPSVARDIGGHAYFAWPVAIYLVGAILGGAAAGRLSERSGLRAALIAAAMLYGAGCVLGALSANMGVFVLGRFVQGAGAGVIVGLCYVSAQLFFPGGLWRRALAFLSLVWGVATVLGPFLGGLFAAEWQFLFWGFAAQAFLFALAAVWLVPKGSTAAQGGAIPVFTLARLALAILLFLAAGTMSSIWGAIGALIVGAVFLVLALTRDARAAVRLLPRHASNLGSVAGQGYATIFLLAAGANGFMVYGAAILQARYGLSPLAAGYAIGVEAMAWTAMALAVAELPHRAGWICIRGGAFAIAAAILSLIVSLPSGSLVAVIVSAAMLGGGFGAAWAYLTRHVVEHLPVDERTVGASAIPAMSQIGNAFGSSLAGLVANIAGARSGIDTHDAGAIAMWVFATAAPLGLLGLLFAWRTTAGESHHAKTSELISAE